MSPSKPRNGRLLPAKKHVIPFAAIVGADEAKFALIAAACEREIGGVLLFGSQGSGKSSLARGLAELLPGGRFVEVPLSVTEDRLVGSIDLEAAVSGKGVRFRPGLLAEADGGVLYVDEVNLLADHLADCLLDVAATGVNVVEREGVAHSHPARFVLVGSMNEAEGRLRPQLSDRFGLAVRVDPPTDPATRALISRRRLEFEEDPEAFVGRFRADTERLKEAIAAYRRPPVTDDLLVEAAELLLAWGVTSMRSDLAVVRAAAVAAYLEGAKEVGRSHLEVALPLVVAHRAKDGGHPGGPRHLKDHLSALLGGADSEGRYGTPKTSQASQEQGKGLQGSGGSHRDHSGKKALRQTKETSHGVGRRARVGVASEEDKGGGGIRGEKAGDPLSPAHLAGPRLESADTEGTESTGGPGDGDASTTEVDSSSGHPGPLGPGQELRAGARSARYSEASVASVGLAVPGQAGEGRSQAGGPARGRPQGAATRPSGSGAPVAVASSGPVLSVGATVSAWAGRRAAGEGREGLAPGDLRFVVRSQAEALSWVLVIDNSGSMAGRRAVEIAKSFVASLLAEVRRKRDRVSMVAFEGGQARCALSPTTSLELALSRLNSFVCRGKTPLGDALRLALSLALSERDLGRKPRMVVVTDGRASLASTDKAPLTDALDAAKEIAGEDVPVTAIDPTEASGPAFRMLVRSLGAEVARAQADAYR